MAVSNVVLSQMVGEVSLNVWERVWAEPARNDGWDGTRRRRTVACSKRSLEIGIDGCHFATYVITVTGSVTQVSVEMGGVENPTPSHMAAIALGITFCTEQLSAMGAR